MFKQKFTHKCMAYSLTLAMVLTGAPLLLVTQTAPKAAAQTTPSNPTVSTEKTTWDCVYFGNYWQSDTNGDGKADTSDSKEPIKWRVLSVNGDDMFLLADQNLDARAYNTKFEDITWEKCTLRSWLNGYGATSNTDGEDYSSDGASFLSNAFSSSEQSDIRNTNVVNDDNPTRGTEGGNNTTDKVYLLSIAEVADTAYGFNGKFDTVSDTRCAKNTAYAKQVGAYTYEADADDSTSMQYEGNGWWWLRSPGYFSDFAAYVNYYGYGYVLGDYVLYSFGALRPALHLSLSSSSWSYAGTVSADVGASSSVTAAPGDTQAPTSAPSTTSISAPSTTNTSTTNYTNKYPTPAPTAMATPSAPVATKSAVTVQTPAQGKITFAKNIKGKKIVIKLAKKAGKARYQVKYSLKKNFKSAKMRISKKSKVILSKLQKKTYYIKTRTYVLNKGKKTYGKWSSVKKVKVKK